MVKWIVWIPAGLVGLGLLSVSAWSLVDRQAAPSERLGGMAPRLAAIPNPQPFANLPGRFGTTVKAGDVDGDQHPELLVADRTGSAHSNFGGTVYVYSTPGFRLLETIAPPILPAEIDFGWSFDVGDIDGNGIPEIAVGAPGGAPVISSSVYVFRNGDSQQPWISPAVTTHWGEAVRIEDVSGDGLQDLIAFNNTAIVGIYLGPMKVANFAQPDVSLKGMGSTSIGVGTADFDRDGIQDIVFGDTGAGMLRVIRGGSFTAGIQVPQPDPPAKGTGNFGTDVAVVDVNGDGDLDLVTGAPWKPGAATGMTQVGEGYVFFGPSFQSWRAFFPETPVVRGHFGQAVAATDLTWDGVVDLAFSSPDAPSGSGAKYPQGRVDILAGPDFQRPASWLPPYTAGKPYPWKFGTDLDWGDLNGDGMSELLVGSPGKAIPGVKPKNWDSGNWAYVFFPQLDLSVEAVAVRGAPGSKVELRLAAPPVLARAPYVLLASLSGTQPGFQLGPAFVPLQPDPLFYVLLSSLAGGMATPYLSGGQGNLDARARATASFLLPAVGGAGLVGQQISFAYVAGPNLAHASRPVTVEIVPGPAGRVQTEEE